MEDSSMAQEREERPGGAAMKEERPGAAIKKTGEAGDDSMRKTTGTQSRSREPGGGALDASLPGRRRERYVIGTRTAPGGRPFAYPQFSMDGVVDYLGHQENVSSQAHQARRYAALH